MATTIKLRNSVVKDKVPSAGEIVIGEVCVGAHPESPMLLFKDSDDNIIQIKPGSGVVPGPDQPDSPNAGDLWFDTDTSLLYYYNGTDWVELGTAGDSPVTSVNGQVGTVVLTASDVGALAPGDNVSELTNDSGYITAADLPAEGLWEEDGDNLYPKTLTQSVGIGTSSPGAKLDIAAKHSATPGSGGLLQFSGSSGGGLWCFRSSDGASALSVDYYASSAWSTASALKINRNNGNVGIGLPDGVLPQKQLDVRGAGTNVEIRAERTDSEILGRFSILCGNKTNNLYSYGLKALNLGTNGVVRFTIEPEGNSSFSHDSKICGVSIGRGPATDADGNPSPTGKGTNMVVGNQAFESNTTGTYNTAIGLYTLKESTTASFNVAVGGACLQNVNANANTAVGYNSAQSLETGKFNVAMGSAALSACVAGSSNTCIGKDAGKFLEGSNNTVLGAYAGTAADSTLADTVIISAGTTERARCDADGKWSFGTIKLEDLDPLPA